MLEQVFLVAFPLVAGLMLAGGAIAVGFARHRASNWLAATLVVCALWLLAGGAELGATDADVKFEWYRFRYVVSVFSAPCLLFTVAELVGDRRWVQPRALVVFLAPYVVSAPFAVTLRDHQLLRVDLHLASAHGLSWWAGAPGPLAYWAMATSYVADAVLLWLLLKGVLSRRGRERTELAVLLLASLVPAVFDLGARFSLGPLPGFNLAPFALVPSFVAIIFLVVRFDTFDVLSAIHTLLIDRIPSPVLVVDDAGLIIEVNQALATELGRAKAGLRNVPAQEAGRLLTGEGDTVELDHPARVFRRSSTELTDRVGRRRGTLWVFADVTAERVRAQQAQTYARLEEEQRHARHLELLVRDLHDGVGGATASVAMMAALALEEDATAKDAALRRIQHLALEGSADIRALLNSLETKDPSWSALVVDFRSHGVALLERSGVAFSFRVEGDPPMQGPPLYAAMSLFRLYKEALTNVVRHAQATRVEVSVVFGAARLVCTVTDDGRGLGAPEPHTPGRGLRNMKTRAQELGGSASIGDVQPRGVEVKLTLPLPLHSPLDVPKPREQ